jgi:hypothetical protein
MPLAVEMGDLVDKLLEVAPSIVFEEIGQGNLVEVIVKGETIILAAEDAELLRNFSIVDLSPEALNIVEHTLSEES